MDNFLSIEVRQAPRLAVWLRVTALGAIAIINAVVASAFTGARGWIGIRWPCR